jgi:2Fe-2S ferredoxin
MPKVIFIDPAGVEHRVDAAVGQSLMRAAVDSQVPGIEAMCGGNCVCATCHAYIEDDRLATLTPPDATERDMLECTSEPRPNSRLCCQVPMTEALDGLVVRVAASQH